MLCDCPGLVMPSIVHSKADLVVAGILSIDNMRDYISPIELVSLKISALHKFLNIVNIDIVLRSVNYTLWTILSL